MRHIVLGAGPLGAAIAAQTAEAGDEVALYSVMGKAEHDMVGTTPAQLDGASATSVTQACDGADVIYLCLNAHYVDWYELFPPRLEAAIAAAAATAATLVYQDTVYVYVYGEVDGPFTEDLPLAASTRKGRLRTQLAEQFQAAAKSGKIRGAVVRTADMYGPGALNSAFNSTLGQRHFYPMLAGKTVSVAGDIDVVHTYGFVDDVARGLIRLGREEAALNGVWHIPAAPCLSHRELLGVAASVDGRPLKIRGSKISGLFIRGIGRFQSDVGEVAEMMHIFEKPFSVSHAKYKAALAQTLDWYRQNPADA